MEGSWYGGDGLKGLECFIFGNQYTMTERNMEMEDKCPYGVLACPTHKADDLEDSHGAPCYWVCIVLSLR